MATQWKCYKQVFRDGWIKSLKSDTNLLISDTMTPGLHLRFYATTSNIVFYLGYMVRGKTNEINIFDSTNNGAYHGHTRTWSELTQDMKNALINAGKATPKGLITP